MDPKDAACLARLRRWRWREGLRCPRCDSGRCASMLSDESRMRRGPATCAELGKLVGVKVATAWRLRKVLSGVLADPATATLFKTRPSTARP